MDLLSEHSEPFSATWPTSGMTRRGVAYELPTPVLLTAGTGSSSSPVLSTPLTTTATGVQTLERQVGGRGSALLPTPKTSDHTGPGVHGTGGQDLRTEIWLLKTPTSQLAVNGGSQHPDKRKAGGHGPTLADEVEHLLPTPTVVMNDGEQPVTWLARRERILAKGINGNGMGMPLPIALLLLESGASTEPPSTGGNESLDG